MNNRLSQSAREQIAFDYESGSTITKIALANGLSEGKVHYALLKMGVAIRPQKRHSLQTKRAIFEAYDGGEQSASIAARFEINPATIPTIVRLFGGKVRNGFIDEEVKKRAVEAYLSGEISTKDSRLYGMCHPTLSKAIKDSGHTMRGRAKYNQLPLESMADDYRNGLSVHEIALKYGFADHLIDTALRRMGVTNAPPTPAQIEAASQRAKRRARRGANHPGWKGGRTALREKIRNSNEYKNWRMRVFVRDQFTCQHCQSTSKQVPLEVDHKHPFAIILNEHNIKTFEDALRCAALWDIDNGQTLCKACHKKTPTYLNGTKSSIRR